MVPYTIQITLFHNQYFISTYKQYNISNLSNTQIFPHTEYKIQGHLQIYLTLIST